MNGRLPLKQSPYGRQTLPRRVSDDSQHFIFRRSKKKSDLFGLGNPFFGILVAFWGSYAKTDVNGRFLAICCSSIDTPIMNSVRPQITPKMSVGALD